MPSLRFTPRNQKLIELLQKRDAAQGMCGLLRGRPTTKTNMPLSYEKVVSRIHVIRIMWLLPVPAAMRISKEKANMEARCCVGAENKTHVRNMGLL